MSGERSRLQQECFRRKKRREKVCERKNKKLSEHLKNSFRTIRGSMGESIALLHSVVSTK